MTTPATMPRKQPKRTWAPAQMDVRPKPPPRRTALEVAFAEAEQPRRHPEGRERRLNSAQRRARRNGGARYSREEAGG